MSDMPTKLFELPESTFMVRQPIFTRDKSVWGYELVTSSVPVMAEGAQASCFADFVAKFQESLSFLVGGLAESQKLLVNLDQDNLCFDEVASTDLSNCIFNLSPEAITTPQCSDFIEFIHGKGGTVALDGDAQLQTCVEVLDKSDFICVSMSGKTPKEIVAMRKMFKNYGGQFLVQGVTSWQDYEGTRALGFNLFQGAFFSLPEIVENRELSTGSVSKMQLMKELSTPDCEMEELARIIESDVALSYRILQYINSASFGIRSEITSIIQAVSLLGLKEVRHWAMMVIMTGLDSSDKGEELSYIALQRARFLSELAKATAGFPLSPSSMFIVGLFSKLDALLSFPMAEVLEGVPLEKGIRDALCGVVNEYRDWLLLLEAVENSDWDAARTMLGSHDVDFSQAATQYLKASSWAAMLMPEVKK